MNQPPLSPDQQALRTFADLAAKVRDNKDLGPTIYKMVNFLWGPSDPGGKPFVWHPWSKHILAAFAQAEWLSVLGPASSGKTFTSAAISLCWFYADPENTVILVSSDTRQGLTRRILGEVFGLHQRAQRRFPWIPGVVVPSMYSLLFDQGQQGEARAAPRGIIGVATKVGGEYRGMSNYVGTKAPRLMLVGDEASLMPSEFVDATVNLSNNPSFRAVFLGNPMKEHDALGLASEPAVGGWSTVQGLPPKTRCWRTRMGGGKGLALQLCGLDTPNKPGKVIHDFLLTHEAIDARRKERGENDFLYHSQMLGMLPSVGAQRQILSRSQCIAVGADKRLEILSPHFKLAALDAAWTSDGDRCVLMMGVVGYDEQGVMVLSVTGSLVVPIDSRMSDVSPEDQIAKFVSNRMGVAGIPPSNLWWDATSHGAIGTSLMRELGAEPRAVDFAGRPADNERALDGRQAKDVYVKKVSFLWFLMRDLIVGGQVRGVSDGCIEELASRQYITSSNGRTDVEKKSDTRMLLGRSPDEADALALLCYGAVTAGGLSSNRASGPGFDRSNAEWGALAAQAKLTRYRLSATSNVDLEDRGQGERLAEVAMAAEKEARATRTGGQPFDAARVAELERTMITFGGGTPSRSREDEEALEAMRYRQARRELVGRHSF